MLEVEPTGQYGRNGNEAVAGAASEAFVRWLRRRYAPVALRSAVDISFRRAITCFCDDELSLHHSTVYTSAIFACHQGSICRVLGARYLLPRRY